MKTEQKRAKSIEKIMNLTISSLVSHLPWTYLKSREGVSFHKKCVKEYLSILDEVNKLW